jgi:hypothetical protein
VATTDTTKPLVVQADCQTIGGGSNPLFSIAASRASGTVNVSPLTNLISALLSKSGDPKLLGIELSSGTLALDAAAIASKVGLVREILFPALAALTLASSFDPIKGTATANGTGLDRLLDVLDIQITPQGNNTSSMAIRLKTKNINETDSQPVIRFTNVEPLELIKFNNLITTVSVQQVNLIAGLAIPGETAGLIANLISRVNACYALPAGARRIQSSDLSPTCALAFVDGRVSNFKENGLSGMDAFITPLYWPAFSESAILPILTDGAGITLSLGTFEYLRPNGVMGITARKTGPDNSLKIVSLEAQVGADGKLGLSGNKYGFRAKIVPFAERRTFLNQNSSNYLSTGVNITVPLQNKDTLPLTKIVVTPPANKIVGTRTSFTMLPGTSNMALPLQDEFLNDTSAPSAGGFLRLRTEYTDANAGVVRRHPSRREFGQYFANDLSESALQQFSTDDVWTLDFYVGGANTPAASQYYRLPIRPLTIAEFRTAALPDLEAPTKVFLQGLLTSDGGGVPGISPLGGLDGLTLPSIGEPEPIEQRVFGLTAPAGASSNIFFTDFGFLLFGRQGNQSVPCLNGVNGDLHCTRDRKYAAGAILMGVELLLRLPNWRELVQHFSVVQLPP